MHALADNHPGVVQRLRGIFKRNPKTDIQTNLKTDLKLLILEPQIICEDTVTFTAIMSTLDAYEKNVSIF